MCQAKFKIGDRVIIANRIPIDLDEPLKKPRTIISAEYIPGLQANLYRLGTNRLYANGMYFFRSYQLEDYNPKVGCPGRPREKRRYRRRDG